MTEPAEVCADLASWLPVVAVLITEPDSDGTVSRSKPSSRPPWNPAVANVVYDVHAAVRAVEGHLRAAVTGTILVRGGSDANTIAAMEAIPALATAVDGELAAEATRVLSHLLTQILQLPAVDLVHKPRKLREPPCPRCELRMLAYRDWKGQVACLSCELTGTLTIGAVSGEPLFMWDDEPEGLAS